MTLNNLSKDPPTPFIGTVVDFDFQEEQVTGVGWGWRYKVALQGFYSTDADKSKIEYALVMMPSTAGSGAADRRRSARIAQGDTVIGFKYGGDEGISIIFGTIPRPRQVKFGEGLFDAKSGYYSNLQPKGLFGSNQEFSDCGGHESPGTTSRCTNKDKTVRAVMPEEDQNQLGIGPDVTNTKGQLKKPPGNELINSGTDLKEDEIRATVNAETANDRRNTNIDRSLDATLTREDALLDAALDAELERARQGDRSGLDDALDIS